MSDPAYTVVRTFSHAMEAHMAIGLLDAEGIPARIRDEHLVTQDWLLSNAVGGVRLEVALADVEAARAVLAALDAETTQSAAQVGPLACPACESTDIEVRSRSRLGTAGWVVLVVLTGGLALLALRPRNHCRSCGRRWGT
jgi:hypothetical protein